MIRKAGYAILAVLTYGIIESLLLGYKYYIVFTILLFFMVAFEVVYFNISGSGAMRKISVTRKADMLNFRKNRKFTMTLHFVNGNPYPVSIHFFDEAVDVLEISGKTQGTVVIPKNGTYDINYSAVPRYIGKYVLGNIRVSISDVFHISSIEKTFLTDMEIHIYPSMSEIRSNRSEMLSSFIYTYGNHYSHKIGQGYNLYGVRPYTFEDDPRFIVWSRYNEENGAMLIKQMEEEREITAMFIIDYSTAMNHGSSDRVYDRTILDIINSSHFMIKNRDNVGFFLYSDAINIYISPDKSGESINRLERSVANIIPTGKFNIAAALKEFERKQKKKVLTFLITASNPFVLKDVYRNNLTIFLINNESFYDYLPDGKFDDLMIRNMRLKELNRISQKVREIRNNGIRCTSVNKKNMLSRIMIEYNHGRSMNTGAS
jgi:uncharacterized protein (DUF58 family)